MVFVQLNLTQPNVIKFRYFQNNPGLFNSNSSQLLLAQPNPALPNPTQSNIIKSSHFQSNPGLYKSNPSQLLLSQLNPALANPIQLIFVIFNHTVMLNTT